MVGVGGGGGGGGRERESERYEHNTHCTLTRAHACARAHSLSLFVSFSLFHPPPTHPPSNIHMHASQATMQRSKSPPAARGAHGSIRRKLSSSLSLDAAPVATATENDVSAARGSAAF